MSGLPAHIRCCIAAFACLVACAAPAMATAATRDGGADPYTTSGGASPHDPQLKPHGKGILLPTSQAIAPDDAPLEVKAANEAGNKIATRPDAYGGGGHAPLPPR